MSSENPGCQLVALGTGQASKVVCVLSSSLTRWSWHYKDNTHGDDGVHITSGLAAVSYKVQDCLCDELAAALPAYTNGWWFHQ